MTVLFVKPNPDRTVNGAPLQVFDIEHRDTLPVKGRAVPANEYWIRRIQDGDCIEMTHAEFTNAEAIATGTIAPLSDDEDYAQQKMIDDAIRAVGDELGAADWDVEIDDNSDETILVMLDDAKAVIAKGTLTQLQEIAAGSPAKTETPAKASKSNKKKGA